MTTALVIVDVQVDFCAGGSLAVPDADAILPVVNGLMGEYLRVILTQDWHPPGHVSFASSHPGKQPFSRIMLPSGQQALWPDHCVAGSIGARFHPRLEIPPQAGIVRKGVHWHLDGTSAFFESDGTTPVGLDALLRAAGATELVLAGLATDVCVANTALDARRLGYGVTVVEAGCRGIDPAAIRAAWERMKAAGVRRG